MILIFRELISAFSMALENILVEFATRCSRQFASVWFSQEFKLIKPSITYYRRQIDKFLWIFTNSARERSETKSPPISLRINKIIRLFSFFFLFLSFSPTLSLRFRIYVIPFPGKERRDPNYLSLWTRRTFHGRCTPETRSSSPNSCRKVIPGQ